MATKRITDEPAYVLHRYDWSESSLILEVFTRTHGRVALVARGAKKTQLQLPPDSPAASAAARFFWRRC